jgi:serine-type D-Ala-D-Ala carboxypeptidase (penicillin-binding protein 5/6)
VARHSRAVYRRRRLVVFTTASVVLSLTTGLVAVGVAPLPSAAVTATATTDFTSAPAEVAVPAFGSTAVQADGYGLLTGTNLDAPVPIASIAKVITALVVLDARPIANDEAGDSITFDTQDIQWLNDSVANAESRADVIEGMTLSARDVITVMLVKSANNYSRTLVRWAFGAEDAFVVAANDWAKRQGLAETVIADASGLSPATQSSLSDLLRIGELALDNPVTAQAVASATVSINPIGELENSNDLLGTLGVNGIKTGTTDEAGACLLYSANLPVGDGSVRVIGVTLGAPDHESLDVAIAQLLSSIQEGFHVVTPVRAGEELAVAETSWSTSTALASTETLTRVVWSSTPVTVSLPATVGGVGDSESTAASLTVQFGDESVAVDMVRMSDMTDPGFPWRVAHLGEIF